MDADDAMVWPTLRCSDARAEIRFLVEGLGFVEALVVPGGDGRDVAHAELRWPPGGGVMLGSSGADDLFSRLGPICVYLVTDEPDALLARASAAGAEVVQPMKDEDYGSRGFTVRDPEGNLWSVGTYRGTPA
jgi:uncharacterized glyoxalase superfamily protein PhnB